MEVRRTRWAFELKETELISDACPRSGASSSCVATAHTPPAPSANPMASREPSGLNVRSATAMGPNDARLASCVQVAVLHRVTVVVAPLRGESATAMVDPVGLAATVMGSVAPPTVRD